MANRRDLYGDAQKGNLDEGDNGNIGQPGVDQWGNPPSGYQPGQDYGLGGFGGAAESPRERDQLRGIQGGVGALPEGPQQHADAGAAGPITSTPRQPSTPSPASNATFQAGPPDVGAMQGLQPFEPMAGPDPISTTAPKLRSLYGSQGGLSGGGLGVPGSASAASNDPLSMFLMQLLGQSGA